MIQGGITGTLYNATTATGSSGSNSSPINFSMASSDLLQATRALCSLPSSGSVSMSNGVVILDASSLNSNNYTIFDLPNSDLTNITSIIINGTINTKYIIINVINSSSVTISGSGTSSGTSNLDNLDTNANGFGATNLLWNFCGTSRIDIYNILLMGSILAPNASINATRANIDGSIIAGSLTARFLNQVPMPYNGSFCFNSTSSSM
jgi:choice-of-anchor A domain-containing protein